MKTRFCLLAALFAAALTIVSCSEEDDEMPDPPGTVRLNMLNEDNGRTWLGDSRVYIERGNNFYGPSCLMVDLGRRRGVADTWQELRGLAPRVAVTPGHGYLVYDAGTIEEFPSGALALAVGTVYYRAYVEDWLPGGVGATVRFLPAWPADYGLPAYDTPAGTLRWVGDRIVVRLPRTDLEYVVYDGGYRMFRCWLDEYPDRLELTVMLQTKPSTGTCALMVRIGDSYTRLTIRVV